MRRRTTAQRGYGPTHQSVAAALLAEHRALYGDWCPGDPDYDHAIHPTTDLVADHIVAGHPEHGYRVACRSLNQWRMGASRGR